MISFFSKKDGSVYAVGHHASFTSSLKERIIWLFSGAQEVFDEKIEGKFIGPRREMVSPWSTNATEILRNMGVESVYRVEEFLSADKVKSFDPMLQQKYEDLTPEIFEISHKPNPVFYVNDIAEYNDQEGLALNQEEIKYLHQISTEIGRKLTDSEVFGFSQVNSEHCRHKIFNGKFIIDGQPKDKSLFQLIKETAKRNPNRLVSAYKDNVAFITGPKIRQFAPQRADLPSYFGVSVVDSIISLKAETHNFPTTVEPFYGASTGSGGEIRDRMAGGTAGIPLTGTAVYMTSYPRLESGRKWEEHIPKRRWLYQTPKDILIKASLGASDFGNKFGQPLTCGSLLTFEHAEADKIFGFDKVIMLAGGVGYAKKQDSHKHTPKKGDRVVVLGGENYRIGMGGGAVSSVDTGAFGQTIELNAVQRANPEMQKRVANVIRAFAEQTENPIVSIHDHGAGGHLNCLSELVEEVGGTIYLDELPIGDQTLSAKEIIGNESQERMGLIIAEKDLALLKKICLRERAPFYVVGEVTGDNHLCFQRHDQTEKPFDLNLQHLFGSTPKTILEDRSQKVSFEKIVYNVNLVEEYLYQVLQLEAVASKDWLTNKVDRCVTGKVALQQTTGAVQLPLNNCAITTIDYSGNNGIATALGHAPVAGLIDPAAGSRLSIARALTNIVWAPLIDGIASISLSANWMWPAKNLGENARLYEAVEAASNFAIDLGINIPTGKDSLSMKQKYPDGEEVLSPGTVIITAVGETSRVSLAVQPGIKAVENTTLVYVPFNNTGFKLGGSSFAQTINKLGDEVPDVVDPAYFAKVFNALQQLIHQGEILAGHDVAAGGFITTLLEMNFSNTSGGMEINLDALNGDLIEILFSEQPAVVVQIEATSKVLDFLNEKEIEYYFIGEPSEARICAISKDDKSLILDIDQCRDQWFKTSFLLDKEQVAEGFAKKRYDNYGRQGLQFKFPEGFTGRLKHFHDRLKGLPSPKAAIIREKGVNSDREMAYALYLAGFEVKDVHMTDLIAGRENLEEINFIVFTGGFSNSDVLGSAKGWAGAFMYNEKAKSALDAFYARDDTLSLGVCNGCQLMMELGLVYPEHTKHPKTHQNESQKFECAFINVTIPENNSVLLGSLSNTRLGIWTAHGEGRILLPYTKDRYHISAHYSNSEYPGNPNGSEHAIAGLHSIDGRHLAMMPHLERSLFPWNWAYYPRRSDQDDITPWLEPFVNARKWLVEKK